MDSSANMVGLLKETLFCATNCRVFRYCNCDTKLDSVVESRIRDVIEQW